MLKKDSSLRNTKSDKMRMNLLEKDRSLMSVFSRRELKVLFSYIRPYLKGVVFVIFFALAISLLEGLKTLSVLAFIRSLFLENMDAIKGLKVFGRFAVTDLVNFNDKYMLTISMFAIFILLSLMVVLIKFLVNVLTRKFQLAIMRDLRKDLYNKIVRFNIDFFNESKSGELLFMINSEVSRFSNILLHSKNLLSSVSTLLIFAAMLFVMAPLITSAFFVFGILFLIFHQRIQRKLWAASWQANFHQNALQQAFYEIIYGMKLIKLGGLEKRERDEYLECHSKFEKENLRMVKLTSFSDVLREGFFILILAFFSLALFYLLNKGILVKNNAFVLSYMVVLIRIIPYFSQFQRSILSIVESYAPLGRIVDILTRSHDNKDTPEDGPKINIKDIENIEIDNLFFSHKEKKDTLKDINLKFFKGKMYALVSFSGGGKSTLLDLMASIRVPNKGKISFNGQKLEEIDPKSLREAVGYMNQEPLIFHDTIEKNISFFKENADVAQIENALEKAAVKDFVYSLPEGLKTGLGERGLTISGGERQRIGLARVFLKETQVLLLDEATNSVDYKTEKIIYDNLRRISKDKIIIVAAHRLSSIVDFDSIIVLHKGVLKEKGTHEQLMANRDIYYSLHKLQEIENADGVIS